MSWHINKQRLCEVSHFKQHVADQTGRSGKETLITRAPSWGLYFTGAVGWGKLRCACVKAKQVGFICSRPGKLSMPGVRWGKVLSFQHMGLPCCKVCPLELPSSAASALPLCPSTLLQVRSRCCLPASGSALMWGKLLPTLHAMVNSILRKVFPAGAPPPMSQPNCRGLASPYSYCSNMLSSKSPSLFSPFLL